MSVRGKISGDGGCPRLYWLPCGASLGLPDWLHASTCTQEGWIVLSLQCYRGLLLAFRWHLVSSGLVVLDATEALICVCVWGGRKSTEGHMEGFG